uniref:Uncharacterized protein n=1 Tax=Populus trichocarpa TaxID=3694 RepID=A0A2K1Y5M7_POPTR
MRRTLMSGSAVEMELRNNHQLYPKRTRFRKQHRGRMKGYLLEASYLFGRYALQALEPAWITSRQIEAGRRAMTRNVRRGGKYGYVSFPTTSYPKTLGNTYGFGKGSPEYWVAVVKPGRMIYEMGGVAENIARKAIS